MSTLTRRITATRLASGSGCRQPAITWADVGLTPHDVAWHEHAHCRDTDPDAFYPEVYDERDPTIATVIRICQSCPVRAACLAYALDHDERHGIWGGHTPAARHRLTTPHRRPRHDTAALDRDIARLTRAGHTAREIAARLGITSRTVTRARARHRRPDEETAA